MEKLAMSPGEFRKVIEKFVKSGQQAVVSVEDKIQDEKTVIIETSKEFDDFFGKAFPDYNLDESIRLLVSELINSKLE